MRIFVFFLVGLTFCIFREVNIYDESWFLQVLCRMNHHETLYRDIFLGVTPLSAWIGYAAVAIFGEQLIVLRVLMVLVFAITIWLTQKIGQKIGIQKGLSFFLPITLFAFSERNMVFSSSLYCPLANLCFLACFLTILADNLSSITLKKLNLAAIWAALCFWTKQTHGVWAFFALIGAIYYLEKKRMRSSPVPQSISGSTQSTKRFFTHMQFVVPATIFFLSILLLFFVLYQTGGLEGFIDFGILNKKNYLAHARISYFQKENFCRYLLPLFILPLFAYTGLFFAFKKQELREKTALLAIFFTTELCNVFPRWEAAHMTLVLPLGLIACLLGWQALQPLLNPAFKKWLPKVSCSCSLLLAFILIIQPFIRHRLVFCGLPHFQGILVPQAMKCQTLEMINRIQSIPSHPTVFFLDSTASFYYLVSQRKNLTPYDFPSATSIGLHGLDRIAALFAEKKICILLEGQEIAWMPYADAKQWLKQYFHPNS